ncbi:Rec8 like protein-domain-containing protein [Sporodiniella umbellata]|nr:Rec8 like protein-domain-containing protein [Sporodiniella umbellata]
MITDQLTKQGPLARVWLASHYERKLSKSQFLQTNIEKTISAIETNQEEEPLALRISGQLLLGVARIYSRKTRYLLEDCNDALVKIKLAFKKSDVSMPDIQHTIANTNAISLQDKITEFDLLLPTVPHDSTLNEFDISMDSLDMAGSQDMTLGEYQNNFSFGDLEFGRTSDNFATEAGRRDQAGFSETAFEPTEISEPFKGMSLDDPTGLSDNMTGFDFDVNDNLNYGVDFDLEGRFNQQSLDAADNVSLDTLMQVGIMPAEDQDMLDTESLQEPIRKRKRLVVDKVTEIPQEDLRKYNRDTSSIVSQDVRPFEVRKKKATIDLRNPSDKGLGSELKSMFANIRSDRRASIFNDRMEAQNDHTGAPTPGQDQLEPFGNYQDFGVDIDAGDFNQDRFNQFEANNGETVSLGSGSMATQNTQTLNEGTRRTYETIESHMQFNQSVKFAEIAPNTNKRSDAARRFYEVLLLASKDKIKVKQERAFSDIHLSTVSAH